MNVVARIFHAFLAILVPDAPPPTVPPIPARPPRHQGAPNAAEIQATDDAQDLERGVYQASAENRRAAMVSLKTSHVAISAEERSRSMLDALMRSMDRGQ